MATFSNPTKPRTQFNGDEIVISGISGIFPDTDDTNQLIDKLYNKVDMVTKCDDYDHLKHLELPRYNGKIKGTQKFDHQFFRVTHVQASAMDPVGRKILEHAFSAFFDAGINPETLKGAKLGVYVGAAQNDAGYMSMFNILKCRNFVIGGISKTMLSNRISYWMDGKGSSLGVDQGCSGSMAALEMAYNRMTTGDIDCALVGGCNHCASPVFNVNMKRNGLLCLDGKTKCFDKNGDGFVRSDAVNIYFLQKAKDAKRIYSEVVYVKGKYFADPKGHFSLSRNPKDIERFFEEFYSEIDVSPKEVEYVEANATGIAEADGDELEAIGNFFGKDKIVKIGSVKSNMGNTEAASGACSITKMCFAYKKGEIPANLHYNIPQNHIPAVNEGRLQVVTENTPFNRKFTAINNFCFTGSNFHALLKGHFIPKDLERYKTTIPRLVLVSGRQEDCVNKMFNILESNPIDPEQIALINNFFKYDVPGHTGRGFTILDAGDMKNTVSLSKEFEFYSGKARPVWFLYSGMGSQWAGMGEDLMRLPVFAAAIQRCHNALQHKGLDVLKIITDKDSASLNILNSFIGITAIQIGLTDVMTSLGIVPDNIIGHSLGEIASAYADGSLTAEQTILVSYARAIITYETEFVKGKMAAVGLGFKEVSKLCPPDVSAVCHNSSESSTISGPADSVTEFVNNLTAQGIFAREVASANIAFHSKYVAKVAPDMLKLQKEFIKTPKLRSKKWLSTCYQPEEWEKPESQYASAEYFTHNLVSNVFFEEAAAFIPDDAIIIEIAPHGLLQAIMKRSHTNCLNLSLTRRGTTDCVKLFLETIGKLYQNGLNPDINALYPKVDFPVSTETPVLAHFIDWDHSVDWNQEYYEIIEEEKITACKEFIVSIVDDDYSFIVNHVRNGVNVLPETALLVFVWQTLAGITSVDYRHLSVVFETINFHKEVVIKPDDILRLKISIQLGSQIFEVVNENDVIVSGVIREMPKYANKRVPISFSKNDMHLTQNDIYTLLSTKGYSYEGEFKSIKSTNIERNKSTILWNDNWISFLDSIIQFIALSGDHDGVSTVKLINKITINVDDHNKFRSTTADDIDFYDAQIFKEVEATRCGGVIIDDLFFNYIPKKEIVPHVLQTRKFMPHFPTSDVDLATALQVDLQILHENISANVIKIKEIVQDEKCALSNKLLDLANQIPLPKIEIELIDTNCEDQKNFKEDVLILHNVLENKEVPEHLIKALNVNSFILAIENRMSAIPAIKNMKNVTVMHVPNQTIVLMKKTDDLDINKIGVMSAQTDHTVSVETLKNEIKEAKLYILVIEKCPHFGMQGVIKEVKKYEDVSLFVTDADCPKFSTTSNPFKEQIQKGLKINILKNGQWGSFSYIPASAQHSYGQQNIKLIAKEKGNIESLTWIETPPSSNKNMIQVYFAGLSMKDYNKLSQIEDNLSFGMDFSGIDSTGARVMGLIPEGAMTSTVEADKDLLWPVPPHWSLKEAATVPLPYIHALYCLYIRSSLPQNGNVFVNGAAGALGQAVISICLSQGCTVFATVGNIEKKKFLLRLFPELDENNIGNTYDIAFRDMVITRTNNKRCNIVINCGSGKTREIAMGCVGVEANFLDINDNDRKENEKFTMAFLCEEKSYNVVNISNIFSEKYYDNKKILHQLLVKGIASGFVRPLTSVVYTPAEIPRAFRLLSIRSNRGRVLINMKDPVLLNDDFEITPRIALSSSKFYIVVCDGTELSIELIDRLIQRGARRLLLHFNPKSMNGYFHVKYASWRKLGVRVEFSSLDLQTESNCISFIRNGNKLGSICDGIFITNSEISENVNSIDDPENHDLALIVSNLDLASRQCGDLRYFAVINATSRNIFNEHVLEEIEKCTIVRNETGMTSLLLQFVLKEKKLRASSLSLLFNAMEASLKLNYNSVFISDKENRNVDSSVTQTVAAEKGSMNVDSGLGVFLNEITTEEFLAIEPIVLMKTRYSGLEHELLINPEETYVIMIPGLDGICKRFTAAAEGLKKTAIALQYGPNLAESVPELAKNLLNYVKQRFRLKSPFYLMGYSFGVNVALEMAALLEREGLVGVVYCIDSSPDAMRVHLEAYLGKLTDEQLQISLIEHFFKLLTGQESTELKKLLEETPKWCNKVELFSSKVKDQVTLTHQYLADLLQAAYNRFKMAKEYKPELSLESKIVLMKGIPHPNAAELSNDYNLSHYTNKSVQVFDIDSNHASALLDSRVFNFVNRTLVL